MKPYGRDVLLGGKALAGMPDGEICLEQSLLTIANRRDEVASEVGRLLNCLEEIKGAS